MNATTATRRRPRWALGTLAGLVFALGVAACGSSPGTPSASQTTRGSTTAGNSSAGGSSHRSSESATDAPTRVGYGSGAVGPSDPTTTLPSEDGRPIQPVVSPGQNIVILKQGCFPRELQASVTAPIEWYNLSKQPQRVVFEHFSVDSGTIPAGGTFTWIPGGAVIMNYRLEPSGKVCKLAVNQAQL
jgi:hypothetical protein